MTMQIFRCSLTFALVMISVVPGTCNEGCYRTSDILSFSNANGDRNEVYINEKVTICCCANAFIGKIWWFRNNSGTFQRFLATGTNYIFQQSDQILNIQNVAKQDGGIYRCVASNETHSVIFDFTLIVHECNEETNHIVIQKHPDPEVYAATGDRLTMTCRAIFGCGSSPARRAEWRIKQHNGEHSSLRGNNSHYSVHTTTERNGMIWETALTFNALTPDNFTAEFTCVLRDLYDSRHFNVKLIKINKRLKPGILATIVSLSVLCFLIFMCVGLVYPRRHQVNFWVKTKLNRLPERYGSDRVEVDVAVLCSSTNVDFVQRNIVNVLKSYGHSVFFLDDDGVDGKPEAVTLLNGLNRSSHGLLYLSKDEEMENFRDFFMHSAVCYLGGSRVIVVHQGSFKQSLTNLTSDLRNRLKIVKRFQWPKETSNKKLRNFWCSVRSCLPVVKKQYQIFEFDSGDVE